MDYFIRRWDFGSIYEQGALNWCEFAFSVVKFN